MNAPCKALLAVSALLLTGLLTVYAALWLFTWGPRRELRFREETLKPLLGAHSTREEVVRTLRLEFIDYSVGSSNRWVIERDGFDVRVQTKAAKYPGVLLNFTAHWKTWLYFDSEGRLQAYDLGPQ